MDNLNQKLYVPIFVLVEVPFVLLNYELSPAFILNELATSYPPDSVFAPSIVGIY